MAGYTRQSSFSDGDTITAALFNNEYNQLVNAFNVSSGHTHDGSTTGDGGPISNLFSNALVFGTNAESDIAITFNAASNDGVLTWKEDEDYFEFSDDLLIATTEKIQFRDTAIYINSSTDGQLDLVADTEIQIAATTVDINGNADISGNLGIGGNLVVTGTTTFNGGTITMGDAATDNVVFGADVDSNIIPDDDNTYDLGSSSQEWKDLYVDGIAYLDGINFNGTAITATAAELNILDGVTSTAAELNILDGVTSTAAELNILDGVTSTAAELNILDGVTSTTAELNILDGVTASATDINLIDGITNGTVIASKAIITDSNKDITGGRNITISGQLAAATLDISGDVDVDGTLEADAITVNGTTLAETISDTVGAMVDSNTETGVTVTYDDSDNTLDFVIGTLNQDTTGNAATATALETARTIGGVSFNGSANIDLPGVNTTGNQDTTGNAATATTAGTVTTAAQTNITSVGTLTGLNVSGDIDVDGTTNLDVVDIDGAVDMASTLAVGGNATVGGNLEVSGADVTITSNIIHAGDTNTFFGFNDADTFRITTGGSEALRVDSSQNLFVGKTSSGLNTVGVEFASSGRSRFTRDGNNVAEFNRKSDHGSLVSFNVDATSIGTISSSSSDFVISSSVSDKDILFKGNDGGSSITALTLDMSNAGSATFNKDIFIGDGNPIRFGDDQDGRVFYDDTNGFIIQNATSDKDILFKGNDGGSTVTALTLDMSDAGSAYFNNKVGIGTTSPAALLDVAGSFAAKTGSTGSSNQASLNVGTTTGENLYVANTHRYLNGAGSEQMRVTGTQVGIGTSSPAATLDVTSSASDAVFLRSSESTTTNVYITNTNATANNTANLFFAPANNVSGSQISSIAIEDFSSSANRTADLAFSTRKDGTMAERMRIDSSGNVGIGTTSPANLLHVEGDTNGAVQIEVDNQNTGNASYAGLYLNGQGNNFFLKNWGDSVSGKSNATEFNSTASGSFFIFSPSDSEAMRIDSSGNVGIGTSSPSTKLDVAGNGKFQPAVGGGDALVTIAQTNSNAYVHAGVKINAGNTNPFYIYQSGSSNTLRFNYNSLSDAGGQMVITDAGNVGIGTASPQNILHTDSASTGEVVGLALSNSNTSFTANEAVSIKFGVGSSTALAHGKILVANTDSGFGSNGYMAFHTRGSDSVTERMRIDASGNLGLGTTSPSMELDVRNDGTNGVAEIGVRGGTNGAGAVQISGHGTTYGSTSFDLIQNSTGAFIQHRANLPLVFATNDTERMRIDNSGRVGIGTQSLTSGLHLHRAAGESYLSVTNTANDQLLEIGNAFSLYSGANGSHSAVASNATLVFATADAERMRLTSSGHVLLGTSTNQGVGGISFQHGSTGINIQQNMDGTSAGAELYVFRRNSTQIGSINQSSTNAVTYNTSSDARLKDVTGASRGLDVINNLNPVAYNWKADNHADEGLIAQEVEKLVPNAVNQGEDGYYSMDYSKLVTHLVKGMQEQQEQIEKLKKDSHSPKGLEDMDGYSDLIDTIETLRAEIANLKGE